MTLYFDSCVLIYAIEDGEAPGRAARVALASGRPTTSALAELECRVIPVRSSNALRLESYDDLFDHALHVVPVSRPILRLAADLRAAVPSLRTPDAIHAATALSEGLPLLTADPGFRRVPGLDVRLLGAT